MPQIINISTEYRNEFKNGSDFTANPSDFTQNYTGNAMEKVQCFISASVEWFSNSDLADVWNVDGVNSIITRTVGDFKNDGFRIGQKFVFISDWSSDNSTPNEFEATIDFIRDNGLRIDFTVTSGAVTSTGPQPNVGIRAKGNAPENYLTGIVYNFGFVQNNAASSFTSLVTDNNMSYQAGNIPRVTTPEDLQPVGGILDWVTGSAIVEFVSDSDFTQNYKILHEFIVHPYYRDGELNDLQSNIPQNEFEGSNSLKHVFELDFRQVLSDPNTAIIDRFTDSLGSVGWFDETFNGLGKAYNIVSISYQDTISSNSVESLQAGKRTTVTIEVEKIGGTISAGQKAGFFVSLLPPQSQYQDKTTIQTDNFLYDGLYHVEGGATDIGTNIIKSLDSSIVSDNLVLVAEIEYNATQKSVLSSISSPFYLIGVNIGDISLDNAKTDRLTLNADVNTYITSNDVSGLIQFDKFDIHFGNSEIGVDTGFTSFSGWNQDSLSIEFDFSLERDIAKDAFLNTLSFKLVAYEDATGNYFELDSTNIDISSDIVSNGIQQINVDSERAYLFEDGNQYKKVQVNTGALVGTLQNYSGVFAQKIRWEEWINNLKADPVFFDAAKANNGLNFESSNYSGINGYSVRLLVKANVQGLDDLQNSVSTLYNFFSNPLSVFKYNIGNGYTCVIETFRASNGANLGGETLFNEDTLIRATFTADSGPVTDLTGFWSAIKMQIANDTGQQISELSTTYIDDSDLLKPKQGFSFADMQIVSGNVVTEVLVNSSKIQSGKYNISARIDTPETVDCFVEFMNGDCFEFMNGDLIKYLSQ